MEGRENLYPAVNPPYYSLPGAFLSTIPAYLPAPFQLFAFSDELCRLVVTDAGSCGAQSLSFLHSRLQPEACQLMLPPLLAQLRESAELISFAIGIVGKSENSGGLRVQGACCNRRITSACVASYRAPWSSICIRISVFTCRCASSSIWTAAHRCCSSRSPVRTPSTS